ncbi:MBL fold metallo-hydrolase [Deinococcus sp. Marseille-Q6407]|uniref:MBL fold metallo-hydrolase n=1 Tax=Deinococcus sp. Marseille-Q6407 TaxID=2969223 RepID=UPI0021BE023D|nr:MBL fold metallo-hydrolase [Deinococcus sp. Marseille-Q6407]
MTFALPQPAVHGEVRIWSLPTGPLQENCYLVAGAGGQGYLIDPGEDAARILALVEATGVQVQAILLTHGHFDHIGAVQAVREALKVPVYLHPEALDDYRSGQERAAQFGLRLAQPAAHDHDIAQDQLFEAEGGLRLMARDLPGHAQGHVVFVGDGFVLAGDTLFAGSIGRTDLPGGNHPQLLAGIQAELLTLDGETAVYPGHGPTTTVGRERQTNPFLS